MTEQSATAKSSAAPNGLSNSNGLPQVVGGSIGQTFVIRINYRFTFSGAFKCVFNRSGDRRCHIRQMDASDSHALDIGRYGAGAGTAVNRVMMPVLLLFLAYFGEIVIYAAGFGVGHRTLNLGTISSEGVETMLDYFYFSVVSNTSLGLGDIFPKDHLCFLSGVEALNGFLLIAWPGAILFAMMNRLWHWPPCAVPEKRAPRNR
ncbi:ion channel [Sulfitobacter sp. MF3-043]|uniref:ion channel n=1 Tax=Sulfitobacter sediminivivens TaxID=3252902 RepID=UPI0036D92851